MCHRCKSRDNPSYTTHFFMCSRDFRASSSLLWLLMMVVKNHFGVTDGTGSVVIAVLRDI